MPLDSSHLGVYLNDHLTGSRAAVALLERIESAFAESEICTFAEKLRTEFHSEQAYLTNLITTLTAGKSLTRQTAGWLSGMLAALKLKVDDPSTTDFFLFESLEALSLGIEGKRSLWIALQILADREPGLDKLELHRLQEQAERQRAEVEARRRSALPAALTSIEACDLTPLWNHEDAKAAKAATKKFFFFFFFVASFVSIASSWFDQNRRDQSVWTIDAPTA